ncbi:MAG: polysaccharide biosynthesis/export family protein [Paludibacteraceae bacterium]|nr:polysaccharide biosynthesis/export family protein [Paludibacteraceae bacterium]
MKNQYILFVIAVILLMSSCIAQRKMTYFNKLDSAAADSVNQKYTPAAEPVIKVADKLIITVNAIDPEAVLPFSLLAISSVRPASDEASLTAKYQYYTVDTDGNIDYPLLGKIHLAGLTRKEAIALLEEKISASVNNPQVTLNFINYSVSVLGEVNHPGRFEVPAERTSVLDALALAGDMTVYGKRNSVLLTRENNGKLEFVRLNLNSPDVFTSPYFYLQQNDVLYVEPNNARAVSSQNLPLYLSMVTTLASMATVIVSVVNTTKGGGSSSKE